MNRCQQKIGIPQIHRIHGAGIYMLTSRGYILMGSMAHHIYIYIAAPWILVWENHHLESPKKTVVDSCEIYRELTRFINHQISQWKCHVFGEFTDGWIGHIWKLKIWVWVNTYRYILVGWTSIYQLFWCSPGAQGFDTLPYSLLLWLIIDPV